MENGLCEEYVYSEDYVEYILESGGDMLDIVSNPEYKPSPR